MQRDVVIGVRLGTILLGGLLAVVASYRLLNSPQPAGAPAPRQVRSVREPAAPPVVPAAPKVARAAPVHSAPALDSAPGVPPPPALANAPVHRRAPRPRPAATTPAGPIVVTYLDDDSETPVVSEPAHPLPSPPPAPAVQKADSPAQDEPESDDPAPKRENRGKRMLKAVGHFLHITHRADQDQQALRQP